MGYTEQVLEFNRIKEVWKEFALTDFAKQEIDGIVPYLSEIELAARQRETSEAKMMLMKAGNPPLTSLQGLQGYVDAAKKGDCLTPGQLEEIEKALVAVRRLKDYLNRCKVYEASVAYYEENLDDAEELRGQISSQIRCGAVDDYASKQLKAIRADISRAEDKMKEKAETIMRTNKSCMSDSFCTFRNGRLCVPVKKECKFQISGSVIDKSSTGNTLFIEPTTVAKYYDELVMLRVDEENEVLRILYSLTDVVAEYAETIEANTRTMEKLDFIFSKGKLSLEWDCVEPIINTNRRIRIKDGRHPLMDRKLCVPLQFEIGGDVQGIVITGPNTGGKTVAIKTVAINCMMAQCGLHVACKEAELCMNRNYLCDIGDGQNISENLSTFSAHITNVLDILRKVNNESLVIMDELGSGTDPTEGMGIAIAILEELEKSGALFVVTTHYPEVKQYASDKKSIQNARMTFDKESLQPKYELVIGEAGESCAFYIASRLGMPDSMLKTAVKAAYGENAPKELEFHSEYKTLNHTAQPKLKKKSQSKKKDLSELYQLGDSVMIYPERKIGIVCEKVNEKGVLRVQLKKKKIWINHKRVKLHVPASQLYPEDYDFSIIFDSVENRKLRHDMERKYVDGVSLNYDKED